MLVMAVIIGTLLEEAKEHEFEFHHNPIIPLGRHNIHAVTYTITCIIDNIAYETGLETDGIGN